MKVGIRIVFMLLLILLFLFASSFVKASSDLSEEDQLNQETDIYQEAQNKSEELDYDEIQKVIDDVMGKENDIHFSGYVKEFITGEKTFSFQTITNDVLGLVLDEINQNKKTMVQLITIAIIAAIFTNFTGVFKNKQVSETGFYITYLLLFSILMTSFYTATSLASNVLEAVMTFMKVLIPTYTLSIAFSAGSKTSFIFYESTIVLITIVDFILIKVIIPLINLYFVLTLANNLSKDDMISKLTELLEMLIDWSLKTLLASVIGFNAIQSLIVPITDHVKNSLLLKTTGAIPGIGNTFSKITETVLGAGVLVKNAIGAAGLIIIIVICALPLIKLAIYVLIYKFGVAVVQPISDKRILNCMNASAEAARLLLYTVFIGAVLFWFTLAIMTATTNLKV